MRVRAPYNVWFPSGGLSIDDETGDVSCIPQQSVYDGLRNKNPLPITQVVCLFVLFCWCFDIFFQKNIRALVDRCFFVVIFHPFPSPSVKKIEGGGVGTREEE